jgi:hypothetical protein
MRATCCVLNITAGVSVMIRTLYSLPPGVIVTQ